MANKVNDLRSALELLKGIDGQLIETMWVQIYRACVIVNGLCIVLLTNAAESAQLEQT